VRIPADNQTFVSIGRNASGNFYALTEDGEIWRNSSPTSDCSTWSACGQIVSTCTPVAIVGAGPSNPNLALNACGDVFTAPEGTCDWSFCVRIPADNQTFVSIGRNASGNFYALTEDGEMWRNSSPTNDCSTWSPCGNLRVSVEPEPISMAGPFLVAPNPGRGTVTLQFTLLQDGVVELDIYDVGGRSVKRLLAGSRHAGANRVTWDFRTEHGAFVSSGTYFARLTRGTDTVTTKLVVNR
jgi:hypothetical protein